jgi:hypothetical protein
MEQEKLRKEIFEKAHLVESSELARNYFKMCGLRLDGISLLQCKTLSNLITDEITPLLSDRTYRMIPELAMDELINFGTGGIFLYTNGYYFKRREAISFEPNKNFIGFCGWASGCNRIPFIKGFIKWCDYLKNQKKEDSVSPDN